MKKSDLITMVVKELKALAKKNRISLPSGARKAEIVEAIYASFRNKKETVKKNNHVVMKKKTAKKEPIKSDEPKAPAKAPSHEWKLPPGVEEPLMAQERVSDAKYYTGPASEDHPRPTGSPYENLPFEYGEEKITLMVRDPHLIYAYWEIPPSRIEREKAWFGWNSKLTVRIYDVTGVQFDGRNAIGYFDQEVNERIGNWYFDVGRASHSFIADIGLLTPEGKFLMLSRSNHVTTPRDNVSNEIDEEWMLIDEEFWKLYGFPGSPSSPQIQEMIKLRRMQQITSPGLFRRERAKRK